MKASHFERIQICCDDIEGSISEYSLLLDQQPERHGSYTLSTVQGEPVDSGVSAWYLLGNTRVELFSSEMRQQKPGITGVVLGCADDVAATEQGQLSERFSYHYQDDTGKELQENIIRLQASKQHAYQVMVREQASTPASGNSDSEINMVDHLVLSSSSAEGCIERFGDEGLGFRLALDKKAPQWGGRMLFYRCGNMTLEVIIPDKQSDRPDSFWGIAYLSTDIHGTRERLIKAGVEVSEVRDGRKPDTLVATVKSHTAKIPTLLIEQL